MDDRLTEWLTTQETAEALGISRAYVQQMHRRGKFPNARKVGNNLFIPPSDVDEYKKDKALQEELRFSHYSVADQYKAQYHTLQESLYKALKMLEEGLDNAAPDALRESAEAARKELKEALYKKPYSTEED